VSYEIDHDDFCRLQRNAVVRADCFFAKTLLGAAEATYLLIIIGLPILTWKSAKKFVFDAPPSSPHHGDSETTDADGRRLRRPR
jgi:hypothetical protein